MPTGGTFFRSSRLPLTTWGMYFLTRAKNKVSALERKGLIGVCYRSAWRVKHTLLELINNQQSIPHHESCISSLRMKKSSCSGALHGIYFLATC